MIQIIERKNGSVIFVGFYDPEMEDSKIEQFRKGIQNLCVDCHNDRAIVVPKGTEIKTLIID